MTPDQLRAMTPEQALQASSQELGLPETFFDRMWKQESGRGKNMTSAAGARGHFQTMPKTQAVLEKRAGRSFDPDNFYDSLEMASMVMKENLGRFKNAADATRAYNGGWDPSRWGNAETTGYVAAVLGDAPEPAQGQGQPKSGTNWAAAHDFPQLPVYKGQGNDYPKLPTARDLGINQPGDVEVKGLSPEAAALMNKNAALHNVYDDVDLAAEAEADRQLKADQDQQRKNDTGFGDVFKDALMDPRVMPVWSLARAFLQPAEMTPKGWDYMQKRDEIEGMCGGRDDCREYMRENVTGPRTMAQAQTEWRNRFNSDEIKEDAGAFTSFGAYALASILDPASLTAGLGTAKLFQLGSIAKASSATAAGWRGVATMAAEGALGNVAVEGLSDALGEVKSADDYAMAALTGSLMMMPFARGAYRSAVNDHTAALTHDLQNRGVSHQIEVAQDILKDTPDLSPSELARKIEQRDAEAIQTEIKDGQQPRRGDQVIPEDVQAELRAEHERVEDPLPKGDEIPETDPQGSNGFQERTPDEQAAHVLDAVVKGDTVSRVITNGDTKIKMEWNLADRKAGKTETIRDVLSAALEGRHVSQQTKAALRYLNKVLPKEAQDVLVKFSARETRANYDPNIKRVNMTSGNTNRIVAPANDLKTNIDGLGAHGAQILAHEIVHAATFARLEAFRDFGKGHIKTLPTELHAAAEQLDNLRMRYREELIKRGIQTGPNQPSPGYAGSNIHEFAAEALTDPMTAKILSQMPGKPVAGRPSSAMQEFIGMVRRLLGMTPKSANEEAMRLIDNLLAVPVSFVQYNGKPMTFAPPPHNTQQAWAARMYQHASQFLAANPINTERLKTITAKVGGMSDGLVLASSKNPILNMVASLVTETTTGAAGRKATVALRQTHLESKLNGNFRPDFENAYSVFRNRSGGNAWEDVSTGALRRQFNREVFTEIHSRRDPGYQSRASQEVRDAADAAEALFDRARKAQVDANTMGSAWLPTESKGYVPQALDGAKLANATQNELNALHDVLSSHWQSELGFTPAFADTFAIKYTERVRRRALGSQGIDGMAAGGDSSAIVRDILEDMTGNPDLADQAKAAMNRRGGLGQVKSRLAVDMMADIGNGKKVMDFYVTDVDSLARKYARRTSGNVALTESGIHGYRGVRALRDAIETKAPQGADATLHELDAYDRVMSEILGTPVAGQVISAGATNLRMLVGLQRLGGLVWAQAQESWNMAHHLGMRSVLSGVASLPRMIGEVGRQKKGASANNSVLHSIETIGGEIGQEHYKLIAPTDAPDQALGAYMEDPGLFTRLVRSGGHLQSKLSGYRGLVAAQHRMVAEQITMKAMKFIRDGGEDVALRDMGFTKELTDSLKLELHNFYKTDSYGQLKELDLTKVSDPRLAEAFVQAVHRGTGQIIQRTYVGERTKWMHNDYLKLLMQLRSFGFTAMEKQWGRSRMNFGVAHTAMYLIAQLALATPLHLARVQIMSAGREDRDKYLKDNMAPAAMVKALMNYSSLSGMASDALEAISGIAGGWGDKDTQELVGGSRNSGGLSRMIPVIGSADQALRLARGQSDLYTGMKQLPFSSLWWLVPAMNLAKD